MMKKPIIEVQGLSKRYFLGKSKAHKNKKNGVRNTLLSSCKMVRDFIFPFVSENGKAFWALKNVDFSVCHGEKVGIIGRNGAGKSTLLKILSRLTYPTEGEAVIRGRVTSLLEVGTGFNPNLTGRENIYLNASLYGLERSEINEKFNDIVEFSGVGDFLDTPVKYYSSGMHIRLAFAVAAHLDPDILLLDEVLAVGDMAFQEKCLKRVEGLTSGGRTILFVSHSMGNIVRFCEKTIWLEGGKIIEFGDTASIVKSYSKSVTKLKSTYHADIPQSLSGETEKPFMDNPAAELISFELSDESGKAKELFFRHEPINIDVKYRILKGNTPIIAAIHLHKEGTHVFSTHPDETTTVSELSVCHAKTVIPPNILNTGDYHFSVAIVTPTRPVIFHVKLEHVLSCKIVEEYNPKRIFGGEYNGVLRPPLMWKCSIKKDLLEANVI